jgi:hypothetical protein
MSLKHETGNQALDAFRNFARYHTHGGYVWAAVFADGELMCERCAREDYRTIYRATKRADDRDEWRVIGLTNSGESECSESCIGCGKVLWGVQS